MKLSRLKIFLFFVSAIVLTLGLSISFQSLIASWTAPLANPTACLTGQPGCDAPLNTGPLLQQTKGGLWVVNSSYPASPYGLIVEKGNVGVGTTIPQQKLSVAGKVSADDYWIGAVGKWASEVNSKLPDLIFYVGSLADQTTWVCEERDLADYCGDADGCTITTSMQHETDSSDQVRTVEARVYMEQDALSFDRYPGRYGWTRQDGYDYAWITGVSGLLYTVENNWDWSWVLNYRHSYCYGANSDAFSNQTLFSFMVHPHATAMFIIRD